jgi:hypothetical protein
MEIEIDLSFRLDEELWDLYQDFKPETVEIEELATFFILPFRLLVDGKELFWSKPLDEDDDWLPALPLIGTVLELERATTALANGAAATVNLFNHGTLTIEQNDAEITLGTSMTGSTATVDAEAWTEVLESLSTEVKELLRERLPSLLKHPDMGPWLLAGKLPEL